eukprot:Lithocolla_globosa_v1_NODE_1072_length_2896_cov_11.535375.p2 type:complete len:311 gc:universal NODE_1072_length_2896_cov_11.535375:980-48(-)
MMLDSQNLFLVEQSVEVEKSLIPVLSLPKNSHIFWIDVDPHISPTLLRNAGFVVQTFNTIQQCFNFVVSIFQENSLDNTEAPPRLFAVITSLMRFEGSRGLDGLKFIDWMRALYENRGIKRQHVSRPIFAVVTRENCQEECKEHGVDILSIWDKTKNPCVRQGVELAVLRRVESLLSKESNYSLRERLGFWFQHVLMDSENLRLSREFHKNMLSNFDHLGNLDELYAMELLSCVLGDDDALLNRLKSLVSCWEKFEGFDYWYSRWHCPVLSSPADILELAKLLQAERCCVILDEKTPTNPSKVHLERYPT